MGTLILRDECFRIVGACFEVYNELGCGFLEPVYDECLAIEFGERQIPYQARARIELDYKGQQLTQYYVADFVCFGGVLVELKALSELASEHRAQVLNYLHATGYRLGILVNFGHFPRMQWERIVV